MTGTAVGWEFVGEPLALGGSGATVTLVEGAGFCICHWSGDLDAESAQGLFFRDTRLLSAWRLTVDERVPEPLAVVPGEPYEATFLSRATLRDDSAAPLGTVLIVRHRYVGHGMREDVAVRNLGNAPVSCRLTIEVRADFADLFEVKEGRVRTRGQHLLDAGPGELRLERRWHDDVRGLRIHAEGWVGDPGGALWVGIDLPGRGEWSGCLQVHPSVNGVESPTRYPRNQPVERAEPARRLREWRRRTPVVRCRDAGFAGVLRRTEADLGALRIAEQSAPDHMAVAAGAPWFMTLLGRDSLLTAWMALPLDPTLALGTLQTLAGRQGVRVVDRTEEEPGRILHEVRVGMRATQALGGADTYYGSVDATPLFVMLLGEAYRWGLPATELDRLLPAADRAIAWIEEFGDRDGDGYVEYQRRSPMGLVNQGWKDSFDGVTFADGRIADPPIALAEVQGYVYAAYRARSDIARWAGDADLARRCAERASRLRAAFNRDFWLPELGGFALALDRDKRPVDSCASNMGHCLWTGIVDEGQATAVGERLLDADMFSGWGVRTLAQTMAAYNPVSYHNGSVWPHDNAIIAAGLMRYGQVERAQQVAAGLLAAATSFAGRLPELFCGFPRPEFAVPVAYPTSCSPQAWAAASPVLLLRTLLRLDPEVPDGRVWLAPELPEELGELSIEHLPLGGHHLDIAVAGGAVEVHGLPESLRLHRAARPAVAADQLGRQDALECPPDALG